MKKEKFLKLMIFIALFYTLTSHLYLVSTAADDYPKGSIRLLIPYAPGGTTDWQARIFQPFLEKELGVPIIIDNRPGAGGEVCTTHLYRQPPDGYNFMSYIMPDLALVCIMQNPIFKFEDIQPIVSQSLDFRTLLVLKDSPLNSLEDFIEEAKRKPGKLSISVVHQTGQQLCAILLRKQLKLDFKIVPFKGGADAITTLLGGHVTLNWGDGVGRLPYREQLKCIGVARKEPHPAVWPEGKPINDQLRKYGTTLPDIPRHGIFHVRAEFKNKYPERYKKLQNAILNVSQNKEYMKIEEEKQIHYIRLWGPGENFEKEFKEQYDFFKKNKDLFKED